MNINFDFFSPFCFFSVWWTFKMVRYELNNFCHKTEYSSQLFLYIHFPLHIYLFILQAQFPITVPHALQWVFIIWSNMILLILFTFKWRMMIISFLACFPIPISVLTFNAQQHPQLFSDTTFRLVAGECQ